MSTKLDIFLWMLHIVVFFTKVGVFDLFPFLPFMGYSFLCSQSLVLVDIHQRCYQGFGCKTQKTQEIKVSIGFCITKIQSFDMLSVILLMQRLK